MAGISGSSPLLLNPSHFLAPGISFSFLGFKEVLGAILSGAGGHTAEADPAVGICFHGILAFSAPQGEQNVCICSSQ